MALEYARNRFKGFQVSNIAKLKASGHWPGTSAVVLTTVAGLSKLWIDLFTNVRVVNVETLYKLVESKKPLITVSNHTSCADDPLMWGILKWKHIALHPNFMRWTLAAQEICFSNAVCRKFFTLGRCIPVIRGQGVYQKGVDDCLEVLNHNGWVHIFPEGRVNLNKERIRLKWGVGRLIAEADVTPTVLPIWHFGMDDLLPNRKPYIPQIGKNVTVVIGDPISFESLVYSLKASRASSKEIRLTLTNSIQEVLDKLKTKSELIHTEFLISRSSEN